jgi:VWFA-related protein
MKRFFFLALIALISILLPAQELKHEVTVALKLIQVYVTDKAGNPVTDLDMSDFQITVNKKLQTITEFEKYTLSPLQDTTKPQSRIKQKESTGLSNDTMNRKFFFFFDLVNNNTKGFLKAQKAALHFIDNQLQPSDEVGIISYSVLKQLTLHEYLTTDRQAIRQVVERIGGTGRVGRAENFEAMLYQQMTGESALDASQYGQPVLAAPAHLSDKGGLTQSGAGAFASGNAASNTRFQRDEYRNQIRNLFSKIIDLSKAFRYISGNKHIIFFSSGIPYSLIHGMETSNPFQSRDYALDSVLRNKFEEVLKELSAANTSVFSVNTEPLATNMNLPENMKGEGTLRRISDYTGGKFIGNVQNYKEILDTVQSFTGSYYVLGYYIDESTDGRYNSIDVSVTRPQCKVFTQKGYFNPKSFTKFSQMEKELHLFDLALTERSLLQTPVDFPMIALPCPVDKDSGVFLLGKIPLEKIRESIGQKAEIFFLAFDEEENLIDVKRNAVKLATLKGKEAYYYSLMNLPPGSYKFRIVMRDMDSGNGAVGRNSLEIPVSPEQGIMLFPPLLLNPGKSGLFVRGFVPKNVNSQFPLVDYFPFDPLQFSPNLGNINGSSGKIQAVLRCSMHNLTKPVLKFTAALIERSSEQSTNLPVSILSGKKDDEIGTLLAEFQMPKMAMGEYILVITAVDLTSQARSQTSTPCRIY